MGLNWDLRTYKTDNLVIINVPIQKGDTYAGGLVNLGYDNFSLDIYVDIIEPLFKIGQQNFALNDLDAAITDFIRVLELAPNHVPSLYHMCYSLCRLNRDKEALPFADRLVKKIPDWDSYNLRKLIKESLGDHKGAKADKEAACESGKDPCF
jgi:tetratricopeptide (TPR) repeat protein